MNTLPRQRGYRQAEVWRVATPCADSHATNSRRKRLRTGRRRLTSHMFSPPRRARPTPDQYGDATRLSRSCLASYASRPATPETPERNNGPERDTAWKCSCWDPCTGPKGTTPFQLMGSKGMESPDELVSGVRYNDAVRDLIRRKRAIRVLKDGGRDAGPALSTGRIAPAIRRAAAEACTWSAPPEELRAFMTLALTIRLPRKSAAEAPRIDQPDRRHASGGDAVGLLRVRMEGARMRPLGSGCRARQTPHRQARSSRIPAGA